jgi:iron complex outermembrane receptor protein
MLNRRLLTCATLALATALAAPAFAADVAAPADAANADDNTILVTGALGDKQVSAGSKSTLPIAETPQSISVITREDIEKLGVANLNQSLRYVAGVTPETRGAGGEIYDQFMLRGFTAPIYLDGLKQFASTTGYATPQVDISRLESINVVKGPASALYGQSSPGGLVAMTSKLPLDKEFYGSAAATYGTYNLYRFDADVGGKLSDAIGVRLYGSANGADTQQVYGSRARQTISGAVTAKIDEKTTLTVLAAYSHDPKNGNYSGAPASGTLFYNVHGKVSTSYADGEPDGFFRRDQFAATYILNHDFGGGWKFRAAGRYTQVTGHLGSIYETGLQTGLSDISQQTTSSRGSYATDETLNNWTFDNQLTGRIKTGPLTHDIMIGLDRQTAHSTEAAAFGSANDLNIFNPVYGQTAVPQTPAQAGAVSNYLVSMGQTGVYGQDTISVGGLRVLLSGREDWAATWSQTIGSAPALQKDSKFTGRAGVLYKTDFGIAPYASYSTSFEPQSATLATGGIAKPSMGKQVEAGVKYQPKGTPILISAAWFHIEQTNVVTTNPVNFLATQSGKIRSEGFEVEANAPLPGGFNVRAAYSHQRVRNVADDDVRNIGGGQIGAGDGNLTVNVDWTAKSGPLKSLNIGAGMRHVSRVYAGVLDTTQTYVNSGYTTFNLGNYKQYYTPAYTLFDASLHYDLSNLSSKMKGMTLSVNLTNIFDKKYLTSCYMYPDYDAWCWYGQRRTAQGTLAWKF